MAEGKTVAAGTGVFLSLTKARSTCFNVKIMHTVVQ